MDQEGLRRAFKTLNSLNPDYAADPNIASSFLKEVGPFNGVVNYTLANDLLNARKTKAQAIASDKGLPLDWTAASYAIARGGK